MSGAPVVGERQRFVSFVVTGGIAAAVNLAVRWGLSHVVRYEVAVGLAYLIAMTTAFLLAQAYVFDRSGAGWPVRFARFALVNVMSFLIVLGVSVGLARYGFPAIGMTWHADDIAHVVGVISPVAASYYAHKHFSFGGEAR